MRDLTLIKEDIRVYLTDGYLIFSKPVAGRRIAAVFATDVEGGDGEVIVLPPDRAERRSLATFIDTPNLDVHVRAALLLFTGDVYDAAQEPDGQQPVESQGAGDGAAARRTLDPGAAQPGASYQVRLTLDLMGRPARPGQSVRGHVPEQQDRQLRRGLRPGKHRADSGGATDDAAEPALLRHVDQFPGAIFAQEPDDSGARSAGERLPDRCHGDSGPYVERDFAREGESDGGDGGRGGI